MGNRVDLVRITLDIYDDFEGSKQVHFSFCPQGALDREMLMMLWQKYDGLDHTVHVGTTNLFTD